MGRTVSSSATSINVLSAPGAEITAGKYIKVDSEIMSVTSVQGDVLQVTRGQAGSTAATHNDGAIVSTILPVTDVASSGSTTVLGDAAAWTMSSGTLLLTVPAGQTAVAATVYTFSIQLTNPEAAQTLSSAPTIEASNGVTYSSTAMSLDTTTILALPGAAPGDASPLSVLSASFPLRAIGQSTPYPGAANTITVTISTNIALGAGSTVTIPGLVGSTTADNPTMSLTDAGSTGVFVGTASWTQSTGTLVIVVDAGQSMAASTAYTLSFTLTNPAASLSGVTASITASGGAHGVQTMIADASSACVPSAASTTLSASITSTAGTEVSLTSAAGISRGRIIRVGSEEMQVTRVVSNDVTVVRGYGGTTAACHQSGAAVHSRLLGASTGDCVPLTVHSPGFPVKRIGQSSFLGGASNTITVTVASNYALAQADSSYVTFSGLVLAATADSASLSIADVDSSGATTVFGAVGAWSRTSVTLTLTVDAGQTMAADTIYVLSFVLTNVAASSGSPLTRTSRSISVSAAGSASITASTVVSDDGFICSAKTMVNEGGTLTASDTAVTVTDAATPGILPGLHLQVDQEVMQVVGIATNDVTVVRGVLGTSAAAHVDGAAVCVVTGTSPGLAKPLQVLGSSLVSAAIGQSTPLPGATNTITTTLVPGVDMSGSDVAVTLAGLIGSATSTGTVTISDVASSGAVAVFGSSAAFDADLGSLTLTGASGTLNAGQPYIFSFPLTNPADATSPPTTVTYLANVVSTGAIYGGGRVDQDTATVPSSAAGAVAGDARPLKVYGSTFLVKAIGQALPYPGATNTISATIAPSVDIASASVVTITGLKGTQTADDATLTVSGADAAKVGSSAAWTQSTGTLLLTVAGGQTLTAGVSAQISVSLVNSMVKGDASDAVISTSGITGERMVHDLLIGPQAQTPTSLSADMPDCSPNTADVASATGISVGTTIQIGSEEMTVSSVSGTTLGVERGQGGTSQVPHVQGDTVYVLAVATSIGDAAALLVQANACYICTASQSNPYPSASNTIKISFLLNVGLDKPLASALTISGLTGTLTADDAALAITDPDSTGSTTVFGSTADWTQSSGTLVLRVSAGQAAAARTRYSFTFSLTNMNGAAGQASPAVSISSDAGAQSDATIYYTDDGSTPTTGSTEYTSAVSVTPPKTLKAIAVYQDQGESTDVSSAYS